MVLWRISRHLELNGIGGLKAGGRWHYPGQPIVYLADSPASALLEVCVHTAANNVPPAFTLLRIEGPDLEVRSIENDELPEDWRARIEITRSLGTEWLQGRETSLVRVPSAIVPQTVNYLLNPLHPDAKLFRIADAVQYPSISASRSDDSRSGHSRTATFETGQSVMGIEKPGALALNNIRTEQLGLSDA